MMVGSVLDFVTSIFSLAPECKVPNQQPVLQGEYQPLQPFRRGDDLHKSGLFKVLNRCKSAKLEIAIT